MSLSTERAPRTASSLPDGARRLGPAVPCDEPGPARPPPRRPPRPPQPAATPEPAQPSAVVVVTGTRASLERAMAIKRDASVVQDSISATELGRFPDDNVADSLSHITGVSISRTAGGEGQYVSVRGFGSGYKLITLNGRILATDGAGRDFAFDVLPSDVIYGADVLKSAQASQIEGSIGGTVNLRSARPFDKPGQHGLLRIEGDRNQMSPLNGRKLSGDVQQHQRPRSACCWARSTRTAASAPTRPATTAAGPQPDQRRRPTGAGNAGAATST